MKFIKRILNIFKIPVDIIISFLIIPSGLIMLLFRKIGSHKLIWSKSIIKKIGIFPLTSNYYEPSFNFDNLKKKLSDKRNLPGINLDIQNQIKNLKRFDYTDELKNLNFNFENNFFEAGDAEIYYQMIRYFKPKKIIEIGSGHSSLLAKEAIKKNKDDNFITNLICIEPYENKWLEKNGVQVIRKKVEDIDLNTLYDLDKNDILFIDSSHVIKPQGDILKIFLEVLPKLKTGVIIHIHDIFTPRDYPENWLKIENRFYNEQYLLEGMLDSSSRYSIMLSLNFLKHDFYKDLKNACPYLKEKSEPSSFYISVN
tara:strand:- start:189 stop:1124 length:936 start_codon:yes stop_codon:yes gene_type:complete